MKTYPLQGEGSVVFLMYMAFKEYPDVCLVFVKPT